MQDYEGKLNIHTVVCVKDKETKEILTNFLEKNILYNAYVDNYKTITDLQDISKIDLIFLEVDLITKDLLESITKIKQIRNEIKVLILIKPGKYNLYKLSLAGADRFLCIPLDVVSLAEIIGEYWDRLIEERKKELCYNSLNYSIDGAFIFKNKDDFPLVYCNNSFKILTGYQRQQDINDLNFLKLFKKDENTEQNLEFILKAIENGEAYRNSVRVYKKNGNEIFLDLVLSPIYNRKKEIEYYTGFLIDDKEKIKTLKVIETINEELRLKNEKIKGDLELAKNLQNQLFPKNINLNDRLLVGADYIPLDELGGDFYDYFKIDDNRYAVIIADVSGHGVSAALVTFMAKTLFSEILETSSSTGECLIKINQNLNSMIGDSGYYLTAICAIIDIEKNKIEFSSGSHPKFLHFKKDKSYKILPEQKGGTMIGPFKTSQYKTFTESIESGDKIFLYTDGLIECRNQNNEFFSLDRVIKIILDNFDLSPKDIIARIKFFVYDYIGNGELTDDITMFFVEIK